MQLQSEIQDIGDAHFPEFTGTRIMMMPFHSHEPEASLPESLQQYRELVRSLVERVHIRSGVAYLTIDEAVVPAGESHRRPGLHVDGGVGKGWGGGGGWGGGSKGGFIVASSHAGCRGWNGSFVGQPVGCGDCDHLRPQVSDEDAIVMLAGRAYWCNPTALHETIEHEEETARQFIRISSPNNFPWYEGYTENPLGIAPTGNILPRREFMDYRP